MTPSIFPNSICLWGSRQRDHGYKRTMVRTTMAMWMLNRLAFHLEDPELKRLGKESLEHFLDVYLRLSAPPPIRARQHRLHPGQNTGPRRLRKKHDQQHRLDGQRMALHLGTDKNRPASPVRSQNSQAIDAGTQS